MFVYAMAVSDFVKEVDLFAFQQKCRGDRVNGCITPSLVKEATSLVQHLEEIQIGLGSKEGQIRNLKVGPIQENGATCKDLCYLRVSVRHLGANNTDSPEVAVVVCVAMIVADPIERVFRSNVLWVLLLELLDIVPEGWNGADILWQCDCEPILEVPGFHDEKRIKVEVA